MILRYRKIENESDSTTFCTVQNIESNNLAAIAITGKLNEVSKIAESLDVALRETQTILELDNAQTNSLDRKTDGNTSIDSRGSIDVRIFTFFQSNLIQMQNIYMNDINFFPHFDPCSSGAEFVCKIVDRG